MSKKLACGADAMVIDLKVGHGALMKTVEEAEALAKMMIGIGSKMNKKVIAVFTAMSEPLGYAIGNALEIKEVIETLKGHGPEDLTALCLELGSHMLVLGEVAKTQNEANGILKKLMDSGKAYDKFKELVEAQGGDVKVIDNPELLPDAKFQHSFRSKKSGYITELNALDIGLASVKLGAGRETKASEIDHGAGIVLKKKIGDFVKMNDELAILYSNNESHFEKALEFMDITYKFSESKPKKNALILKTLT
jgi:pyrimidine-nucleoside phosphorylase